MSNSAVHNPLVVALDVETAQEALSLVERLRGLVGMFKVGSQLFTTAGPEIVRKITALGEQVFLDLKFHDIPNTVAKAGLEAARLGVRIFNIHTLGGSEMMRTTVETIKEAVERERIARPLILGVTILTSHTPESLTQIGIERKLEDEVVHLATLSRAAGLDGVVASPHEIIPVRQAIDDPGFILLTPGIRPTGVAYNDQSRVMTPAAAVRAGANYLVIGRPITAAADPIEAALKVKAELIQ
ncbi:MAG TPA: orotidine-5'-phosphate decarboxylase [Blastocatellia bacterium]|nr:orotidine-5'-phosphate decarboxylase [Blastocatellia bacterium]